MDAELVERLSDEPVLQAALKRLSGHSRFRCVDPDHRICRQALADLQYTADFVTRQPRTRSVAAVSRRDLRNLAVGVTSWAIPNVAALRKLVELSPIIEIGAGLGFWAHLVEARGGVVHAFDVRLPFKNPWFAPDANPWHPVESSTLRRDALKKPGTLFLCWPPGEGTQMAYKALKNFSGDAFVYVGEADSSCMATPEFFALLEAEWRLDETVEIPQWPSCFDKMFIYRRSAP